MKNIYQICKGRDYTTIVLNYIPSTSQLAREATKAVLNWDTVTELKSGGKRKILLWKSAKLF